MQVSVVGNIVTITVPHSYVHRKPMMLVGYQVLDEKGLPDAGDLCRIAARKTNSEMPALAGVYGVVQVTANETIFTVDRSGGNVFWALPLLVEMAQTVDGRGATSIANSLWDAAAA